MNRMVAMAAVALAAFAVNAMPLAEARAKTDAVIADPAQMQSVMKELSAADQKAFLASVNQAIAKLPGNAEEKSAKYLNIGRAALKGASRESVPELISEIYATVPPESLTVISEAFAADVLNRATDPSKTYTDEEFTRISKLMVSNVLHRVSGDEHADVRGALAALTMIRASNGSPADLADQLAVLLPGEASETAKNEWFPEALGPSKSYDSMLAGTDADKAPDIPVSIAIAGPQGHWAMLDIFYSGSGTRFNDGFGDISRGNLPADTGIDAHPRSGGVPREPIEEPAPQPGPGPRPVPPPYPNQNAGRL